MTHLNIQQGLNIEVVSSSTIKKLYEAALSVPEPLEGELDAAYMSGNLLVDKTYRTYVSYLTTRFSDLHINVTDTYYIPFEDPNVQSVLMANNISSDGIGITETDAATANLGTMFKENTTITSFNEFGCFTRANTSPANEMFRGCTNLSSVDFSNTTSIAHGLFWNTALTTLSIPNLQTLSGQNQFNTCTKLTEVLNLGSITSIPAGAFWYCPLLTHVVLPESCTSLDLYAFTDCPLLLNINLQNVVYIGKCAFLDCIGLQGAMDLRNVVFIGETGFRRAHISGILNLPNLTSIEWGAFRETAITSVLDLGSITSIPTDCFYNCTSLTSFTCFSNITSIESGAFCNTKITGDLSIPNLTGTPGNNAFRNTNITSISDLGSITGMSLNARYGYGEGLFNDCKMLTTVTLPSTLTSISSGFSNCTSLTTVNGNLLNLTSLTNSAFASTKISSIPNMAGLLIIGRDVFYECSLLSVAVNCPNLTSLGDRAFGSSGITSVVNLGSITSIPSNCFLNCTSLTSVTLPSTCTSIGNAAFKDATSLTAINLDNIISVGGMYTFGSTKITNFILPNIQTIANSAFRWCKYAQLIDMGPNLSSIGDQAFAESTFTVFIFRGITVPSFDTTHGDKFLNNMNNVVIYVPESALSDYQTAWPQMASNMVKIEGSVYDTQS